MPCFARWLNDAQMAAVITHMRDKSGNPAGAVSAAQVSAVNKRWASHDR
jgi:hypothetical protein